MNSHPVLIVLAIAVAAPLLAEIPIGVRLPALVLEMVLGIIALGARPPRVLELLTRTIAGVLLSRIARTAPTALT